MIYVDYFANHPNCNPKEFQCCVWMKMELFMKLMDDVRT
jgi:hypothetical protein